MTTVPQRNDVIAELRTSLGSHLSVNEGCAPNEIAIVLQPDALGELPAVCSMLTQKYKARFVTLIATDERSLNGTLSLYYVFSVAPDDLFLILRVPVDPRHMEVPSISPDLEAVNWFEREVKDWFGIVAFPNITPLASHPDWPEDVHIMLKDVDRNATVPRVRGRFEFKRVEGEGVFEIPVGPVHAGIIEPGHFRFSVAGEPIINLATQLFYTHKGTEKIAEGLSPHRAVVLAERISGDSSLAHALAYCHCIERIGSIEISQRGIMIRTMLLELERLYNHIGDIGAILLDVGFAVGAASASILKERLLQLNEVLVGSRLLHNQVCIGGVQREPESTPAKRQALRETLTQVSKAFEELVDLALSSSSVIDRLETTGVLTQPDAQMLGVVGVAGRASGIDRDLRRDHPHCAYPYLRFTLVGQEEGDVLARMNVRIDEVREAFSLLEQLQHQHVGESIVAPAGDALPALSSALGYVEGWRGEIVHWVMTDRNGNIFRWKITDPSFHNWRALPLAVRNNIVPDFPVINKSFNLSYSGNDR
jgi:Ni,Fe-hydrogenase III large subunit/Ni,Fe-hydrogenase III component G